MQRTSSGTSGTPTSPRRQISGSGVSGMPPVPSLQANTPRRSTSSQLSQSMAKSMTIDEMRFLHDRALKDAQAKRTELRLVLASRYRELVGSSDEVIKMKERAQELHDLVHALPQLMQKLTAVSTTSTSGFEEQKGPEEYENTLTEEDATLRIRHDLALLPRLIHRALDSKDVHKATVSLIKLFTLISSQTDMYPMANSLSTASTTSSTPRGNLDPALNAQMRMIFLQVQTLPDKIRRISSGILTRAAGERGSTTSAAALASLNFLETNPTSDRAEQLLQTYFTSKAKLLVSLLGKLKLSDDDETTTNAEEILTKIVLILQRDIIVDPYQIFCLRTFPGQEGSRIMSTLPLFDKEAVKVKCSKFLAAHLPLIRTKVKSVLVTIAGTTASALGQIRQSLYDKTDGAESMERLNENGVCTWDEAVFSMIDVRTVLNSADAEANQQNRFSLWGALFSNTFSSLVHSLLTTSFQSVHTRVVSTLRDSLANAPPLAAILPHEAYRNTLRIATELDRSLLKVSADAHELLVHAEERVESERRLRQSLYVQTCEIMGRLICELRRMACRSKADTSDATKEMIVGRLCFLLKFRLSSLRTLLSPESSPASMHSTGGMISYVDLQSAFELADDDEDGLVSFEEAMDAVESAFSGTPFRGAEMVRETLLLSAQGKESTNVGQLGTAGASSVPANLTLSELTLLTARGLRHDKDGAESALGTVQLSLDNIVDECFRRWAKSALSSSALLFEGSMRDFVHTASTFPDEEWQRMFSSTVGSPINSCRGVSPHVVGFLLDLGSSLNRTVCPSDSLSPVPTADYASSLGVVSEDGTTVPTLMDTMRWALLLESLIIMASLLEEAVSSEAGADLDKSGPAALIQLHVDISFVKVCFLEKNRCGFGPHSDANESALSAKRLETVLRYTDQLLQKVCDGSVQAALPNLTSEKHQRVLETSDLFFSSFLGDNSSASVSAAGELMGSADGTDPIFHVPLSSSRRFALLPVQADRSLSEIQIRGKYAQEKEEAQDRQETAAAGNVISGGFGFLSNMLKTKK